MENKRILLIVPEFPPHNVGGGGIVFDSLAKSYKKLGNEVLVISGDYTIKNFFLPLSLKQENGIKIIRIPEIFTPISLLNTVMPYPWHYNLSLKKIIKNFNPDFAHIHGYGLFMPAQVASILRKLDIDYIFTIHGAPVSPEKMGNSIISNAYKIYHKLYGFPMLNGAKRITAVSEFAKNFEIFKKWRETIVIVGNGVNPEDYREISTENLFEKYGIERKASTKIMLSLGRIEWIKGFDAIIKLLPEMKQSGYDIKYIIGGRDNGEKSKLLRLAKNLGVYENVIYLDFITGKEKNFFLKNSDIIAIPSITETYGIVALEARFFQKTVLSTFSGGLKDALEGYKNAYNLEDWKNALGDSVSIDDNISKFYYEEIAKTYLSLNV